MAGSAEKNLQELGISLPKPPAPIANYVPFVRMGNLLTVSGQVCFDGDGKLVAKGQLGASVSIEDGQKAARACAINLLAQVKVAIGDLDNVVRVVRLGGFINSAAGFGDGPGVIGGDLSARERCRAHGVRPGHRRMRQQQRLCRDLDRLLHRVLGCVSNVAYDTESVACLDRLRAEWR